MSNTLVRLTTGQQAALRHISHRTHQFNEVVPVFYRSLDSLTKATRTRPAFIERDDSTRRYRRTEAGEAWAVARAAENWA